MSDHTPTNPTPANPAHTNPTPAQSAPPRKSLWDRIPRRLFHGKVRTTTVVLVVLFLGALALYGQRSEHYEKIDEQNRQAQVEQVQQRRTPTPVPETSTPETEYSETPETTWTPSTTTTIPQTEQSAETTDQERNGNAPQTGTIPPPASTSESTRGLLPGLELPTMSIAP